LKKVTLDNSEKKPNRWREKGLLVKYSRGTKETGGHLSGGCAEDTKTQGDALDELLG